MANKQTVTSIPTEKLRFDPENPRFYRLNEDRKSVDAVIKDMVDGENVQDLMASIGQKGYFEGEPLLVIQSPEGDGDYIVVEGNRRLAAVKLLNGEISVPKHRQASLSSIRDSTIATPPKELPCLIYAERKKILQYLGYRHITGIKEWDSLSKAKYLRQLRDEFYSDEAPEEQLKSLARDIGSRSDYVGQLLTALSLYTEAKENDNFFRLPIREQDIEFSYISTALNYSSICGWLGLENKVDFDTGDLDLRNLKKAFSWMFAKDQQGTTILGESRNLNKLASIVSSPDAVEALENTKNLDEAFLYTDGPEEALQRALEQAQRNVQRVWNMLLKTKPLTKTHNALALDLFDQAKSVRDHLRTAMED